MTQKVKEWLSNDIGMETRETILGHTQRGGTPTVHDRLMAFEFVTYGIDGLIEGKTNQVVVYKGGTFDYRSIDFINSAKYQINPVHLKMGEKLCQ